MSREWGVVSSVDFNQNENVFEVKTDSQSNTIEFLIMLLTNVTVNEEGQKHILGDGKTKGLIVDNLFGMFCYFLNSGLFDFVSNILANVTALKEGREYVIESKMTNKIVELVLGK